MHIRRRADTSAVVLQYIPYTINRPPHVESNSGRGSTIDGSSKVTISPSAATYHSSVHTVKQRTRIIIAMASQVIDPYMDDSDDEEEEEECRVCRGPAEEG